MSRIVIVTDAWKPQTNGVVQTLTQTGNCLREEGHDVLYITPQRFKTFPCPTYPEIRLAWRPGKVIRKLLEEYQPDHIHIATEGPLGYAARRTCKKKGLAFTTSYHTQFPEYVRARFPIPLKVGYWYMRRFHSAAKRTMVGTPHLIKLLQQRGLTNLKLWTRGVDTALFRPREKGFLRAERPISMYLGRVAVEKNIEAFLKLDIPGTKYVVGDGPALERLQVQYPNVTFLGYKFGEELAEHLASADVFVFPSRTDTFGLVLLEAMACGVPVAAYPVTGPLDVVRHGKTGILDQDLGVAVEKALTLDGAACREHALNHTWEAATALFKQNLVPCRPEPLGEPLPLHTNHLSKSANS